jgi:hypothetical protein
MMDDLDELTTIGLMRLLTEHRRKLKRKANRDIVDGAATANHSSTMEL